MDNVLKIDDTVLWRGTWNKAVQQEAKVMAISVSYEGKRWGCQTVESVDWELLRDSDRVIVTLTNGYWAYGYQLEQIK